jgi:hypothetical protein
LWLLFYHVTFGSIFSDLLVRLPDDMKLLAQPRPKRWEPLLAARGIFRRRSRNASIVWNSSIQPPTSVAVVHVFFDPCLSHRTTSSRSSNNRRPGPRVGLGLCYFCFTPWKAAPTCIVPSAVGGSVWGRRRFLKTTKSLSHFCGCCTR